MPRIVFALGYDSRRASPAAPYEFLRSVELKLQPPAFLRTMRNGIARRRRA
jgi:hypothetical protein